MTRTSQPLSDVPHSERSRCVRPQDDWEAEDDEDKPAAAASDQPVKKKKTLAERIAEKEVRFRCSIVIAEHWIKMHIKLVIEHI